MLVDKAEYLSAGIHIGMKECTKYMKQFVYKTREDGLSVFNLQDVDNRIAAAINLLSNYNKILVVSHKQTGFDAAKMFGELVTGKVILGRFSPGTLTNPHYREFYEPEVVLVVDPLVDRQAIDEAKKRRVPVIGLCDTFNEARDIDFVVPINNNGKKSLALFFWLLSRGLMKAKGKIKGDDEFKLTLKDFGDVSKPKEETKSSVADVDIDIQIESSEEEKKATTDAAPKKKKASKPAAPKKKEPAEEKA